MGILARSAVGAEGEALVRRMAATLVHRGPDGEGYVTAGRCALGLRRLAIVDLEAPCPPFADEQKTIWSAANAEVYNADELRAALEARGHAFRTRVDTEVLPHLYEEHGAGLVHRLDGMFALALWDARREILLLARDRAGEKPLFYWRGDDELVFASELRALLVHPRVPRAVDAVALRGYLLHGFFPSPLTPFAGVRKLPAGCLLLARPGEEASVRRYWDLAEHFGDPAVAARRPADVAAELDARIALAVRRRRRSDVPLGIFLSGGIDSATLLAHLTEQQGAGVPAFTLGHRDRDFDESPFARATSRHFDADLHELILGDEDLAAGLERVGQGFDEPLGDASTIPTHLLALFARQRVKVVMSGEGADELFAGYPTYVGHRVAAWYRRLPRRPRRSVLAGLTRLVPVSMGNVGADFLLSQFAAAAELGVLERHHLWFGSLPPWRHREVLAPRVMALAEDDPLAAQWLRLEGRCLPDDLARVLYSDFTLYLADDLLTKIDRATMLASLEARAPFLDHQLAQFVAGLPSRWKLSGLTTKAILRRAVRGRLPPEALRRRKRGFSIPFSRWLLRGLGGELRARFAPERVAARGLLSPAGVAALLDEHLGRRADHRKPLFTLLALDLWCDKVFGAAAEVPIARGPAVTADRAEGAA